MVEQRRYIAAVDVGTTFIRCQLYDSRAVIVGAAQRRVQLLYPAQGRVELSPETIWHQFVTVVKEAVQNANATFDDVVTLGICTQRGTFLTWDKDTGQHLHNFVTWQDNRSMEECEAWNNSLIVKAMHVGSRLLYWMTRHKRYLAASLFRLLPSMMTLRLKWVCKNIPQVAERLSTSRLQGGCIGTWLLWKLTGGRAYSSEVSLLSSTGMFDPFTLDFPAVILRTLGVEYTFLPPVTDTSVVFGTCDKEIFGKELPITAMAGDQQAAMFGCCCFERGSVKISLGTGAFIDINTGQTAHASMQGLYPLVGWKIDSEVVYLTETSSHDAGSTITWAQSIGLFDNVEDTTAIATSVDDTDGVFFVPAFNGLQAPVEDPQACALFLGLKPSTTKAHLVRAILEAIAFRAYQVYSVMKKEAGFPLTYIKCVGGVARNAFVCQMIADLCDTTLSTMKHEEVSSLGIAFLAGLSAGIWKDKSELKSLAATDSTYTPNSERRKKCIEQYQTWQLALDRSLSWYSESH